MNTIGYNFIHAFHPASSVNSLFFLFFSIIPDLCLHALYSRQQAFSRLKVGLI